jgi:hypothetical protein
MSHTPKQQSSEAPRVSLYDEVTERIVRELEAGTVPWVKPWKESGTAFSLPRSAATRKPYGGINILILWDAVMTRGFARQEWLTFRQALDLGGHVKKGERGTSICYADRFILKKERERARESGDEANAVPFLKRFTVFNIEQCENLSAHIVPPPTPHAETNEWPAVEALIAATGADIREKARPRGARRKRPNGAGLLVAAEQFGRGDGDGHEHAELHDGAAADGQQRARGRPCVFDRHAEQFEHDSESDDDGHDAPPFALDTSTSGKIRGERQSESFGKFRRRRGASLFRCYPGFSFTLRKRN